jgi:hypothetical protein
VNDYLLPTLRQRCALRVSIEAPAAYQHGMARRHMQQPAPEELLEGEAHRLVSRRAFVRFGALGIPEDDLLAIAREQATVGQGPPTQVAGQVDQHPMTIGIALADMYVPLLTAQLVEEVLHLLPGLPRRGCELPLVQPLTDGLQEFAPEQRHDHSHRQQKPVAHRHPLP